ncbi:MAG: TlpA disulfide reductase family protein [Nocardioides sp.]|nr:TlpA disulfide reductase family protein [Nocardioides sp.]
MADPTPSGVRVWRSFLGALALVLVVGGLAAWALTGADDGEDGGTGQRTFTSRVVLDTPALRDAKNDAGIEPCVPGAAAESADGLPDLSLPCLGGGPAVDLARLDGPLVLNLWAQWCAPCREELPIYQEFHERYGDQVAVWGVNWNDTQPARAIDLLAETGATYPQVVDLDLQLGAPLRVRGLPMLVLVDGDGHVRYAQGLEITSLGQLEGLVEEHLGVRL